MADLTPDNLQELRRIAEAATPGPLTVRLCDDARYAAFVDAPHLGPDAPELAVFLIERDARFFAEFDRDTVLAMLDEIERLRREREKIADSVTRFALYNPDLNVWECQAADCRFWWEFESGDPYEHDMRFCPRCGRRIVREEQQKEALYGGAGG